MIRSKIEGLSLIFIFKRINKISHDFMTQAWHHEHPFRDKIVHIKNN